MVSSSGKSSTKMAMLLEAGADPAVANRWGLGAADWATWPDNSAEVLDLLQV